MKPIRRLTPLRALLVLLIPSAIVGCALAAYGPFEDSAFYFNQFVAVGEDGYVDAFIQTLITTEKFEPGLFTVLASLHALNIQSEGTFVFFGYLIVTSFCLTAGAGLSSRPKTLLLILALLSYWLVSRNMYFWRASASYSILVLACLSEGVFKRIGLAILAILFHYSAALFLSLYGMYWLAIRLFDRPLLAASVAAALMVIGLRFGPGLLNSVTFLISQGELESYTGGNSAHALQAGTAIFAALALLIAIDPKTLPSAAVPLRGFFVFLLLTSLLLIDQYHLSSRVATPALLFSAFMAASTRYHSSLRNQFIVILLITACLPTLRLAFNLATGTFDPPT